MAGNDFDRFERSTKKQIGVEGFVIQFNNGLMYKIKTNWYFSLNKSLDKIKNCSERHLWKCILNEEFDDLKGYLPEQVRLEMEKFAIKLNNRLNSASIKLFDLVYESHKDSSRREFAEFIKGQPVYSRKILWAIKDLIDQTPEDKKSSIQISSIRNIIIDAVKSTLTNAKSWEGSVALLDNLKYKFKAKFDNNPSFEG